MFEFSFGKIFLGDAGATSWATYLSDAIILVNSSSNISPFAIFLIFFWPIADTWQCGVVEKKEKRDQPDRLHFHQLLMRFLYVS